MTSLDKLIELTEKMLKQFVALLDSNNKLLLENLRLMKEIDQLKKEK